VLANRVTRLLGVDIPIVLAPMGWIARAQLANQIDLSFGGEMETALAMCGQVAGRSDSVRPVAEIIHECARDCLDRLADLAAAHPRSG
jgi:enoyl-[acyl-carrier protein] reductase II